MKAKRIFEAMDKARALDMLFPEEPRYMARFIPFRTLRRAYGNPEPTEDPWDRVEPWGYWDWDITAYLSNLPKKDRLGILSGLQDEVDLRLDPEAPQWMRDWQGPHHFIVYEVDEDGNAV